MIRAVYIKLGNIEKYFQMDSNLIERIKSCLFNIFYKDIDFLNDLLANCTIYSEKYNTYIDEKELFEEFCNNISSCQKIEDVLELTHPKHKCKLIMKDIVIY